MKKLISALRRFALIAATGMAVLTSCQAPQEVTPQDLEAEINELEVNLSNGSRNANQPTIVDIAVGNPNFSALVEAVKVTGLVPTLANRRASFTVFAPTNDAFAKLPAPFNTPQSIATINDQATKDALRDILLYHVVHGERNSRFLRREIPANTEKRRVANSDNRLYFSNTGNGIFVNGNIRVVIPDVDAANGIIHALDAVLIPPDKSIVGIAVGNPAFATLVAAVLKTGLANTLSSGSFTVFAPTNDAFAKLPAPFNNARNINAIHDPRLINDLRRVLFLHVDAGLPTFSTDLRPGRFNTLGGNVVIGLSGGPTVTGGGNERPSNIVAVNVLANNGVVHVIDQVLLPGSRNAH
ncbi:MAG: fasciclin domain-containing protein [Bernardetiaceae bacterium]|jgi:uncharacterized surface protein with fasciclin (FAS1) repeats|nr:fasciclin domain-containing protein [Bernardetiaceae bacterium]